MPKITNISAGVLLVLCGLAACFTPLLVADYYGFVFEQIQAKTTLRVIGGFFIGVGGLFIYLALQLKSQQSLLLALIVILVSFALPRILGLIVDGASQEGMWHELAFEVLALLFVIWVYCKGGSDR